MSMKYTKIVFIKIIQIVNLFRLFQVICKCIYVHYRHIEKVFEILKKEGMEVAFKGGALLGKESPLLLKGEEVRRLANLPSFEELIGQTILGIEGPLMRMQLVLSGLLGNFILVLRQISQNKEIKGGEN